MARPPRSDYLARRSGRADAFFAIYSAMPTRSLEGLHATATRAGLRISIATLKRYSAEYGWQERLRDLDAEAADTEAQAVRAVDEMNRRQAGLGQLAQRIAGDAFALIGARVDAISPREAIRLARDGVYIERLAMGEATSRAEVLIAVYSKMVIEVVGLFAAVNELPDPAERRRRFGLGVDAIVDRYIESDGNPRTIAAD